MKVTIKEIVPTPPPCNVILELTQAEAAILRGICRNIGGLPDQTYRCVTDKLELELNKNLEFLNECVIAKSIINQTLIGIPNYLNGYFDMVPTEESRKFAENYE